MTYDLTWQDLQILLSICCTVENKKQKTIGAVRGHTDGVAARSGGHDVYRTGGNVVPDQDNQWSYQSGAQDL